MIEVFQALNDEGVERLSEYRVRARGVVVPFEIRQLVHQRMRSLRRPQSRLRLGRRIR